MYVCSTYIHVCSMIYNPCSCSIIHVPWPIIHVPWPIIHEPIIHVPWPIIHVLWSLIHVLWSKIPCSMIYYPLSSNTFVSAHLMFRSGNVLLSTYLSMLYRALRARVMLTTWEDVVKIRRLTATQANCYLFLARSQLVEHFNRSSFEPAYQLDIVGTHSACAKGCI